NTGKGIYIANSHDCIITSCTVNNKQYGFYTTGASAYSNRFENNISSNCAYGINFYNDGGGNIVSSNTISNCSVYGIWLYLCNNNMISRNAFFDNADVTIFAQGTSGNEISSNTYTGCRMAAHISGGECNKIINNECNDNTGTCFYIYYSSSNFIYNNQISGGNSDGITFYYADGENIAKNNTITGITSGHAVFIYNSENVKITENYLDNNISGDWTIHIDYGSNNEISNNTYIGEGMFCLQTNTSGNVISGNTQVSLISNKGFAYTGFGVPGYGEAIVQGNYAYVVPGEGHFQVIDLTSKSTPTVVGYFYVGFKYFLDISSNVAFITGSDGIWTLDISDPYNPKYLNDDSTRKWYPQEGLVSEIRIIDEYAYVTVRESNDAFYVLDISSPTNITEVASVEIDSSYGARGIFIYDNTAYLEIYGRPWNTGLPEGGGVIAIDISEPTAPSILGSYDGTPLDSAWDTPYLIGICTTTAIMATNWSSTTTVKLILVDMSDPENPNKTAQYEFPDRCFLRRCETKGNYIYVIDPYYDHTGGSMSRTDPPSNLFTFDISAGTPTLVTTYTQSPTKYRYVSKYNNYLYINDFNYGIRIFDISISSSPQNIGGTVTAGEGHWSWTNSNATISYISQTFGGSIYAIDVTDPSTPRKIGKIYWDGEGVRNPIEGKENVLYVPKGNYVTIVDYSDVENPINIGDLEDIVPYLPRVVVEGNSLYVIYNEDDESRLSIYDISYPTSPVFKSELTIIEDIESNSSSPHIYVEGNYAYIMSGVEKTLWVVDVSDPETPEIVGELYDNVNFANFEDIVPGSFSAIYYSGNIVVKSSAAYIMTGDIDVEDRGIHIVDISNPSSPQYEGFINNQFEEELKVYNDYLIIGGYFRIAIYDITDVFDPIWEENGNVGNCWSLGNIRGLNLYSPSLSGLVITELPTP
ncbi:MAG: right-handed parallel beta-helix repeat-containing protein, partial [Endomicrobiales bacterium]|nr:right-handed parallel beta-helix repeat-containing protein [Endomicrobiales bacterium]